MRTDSVTLSNDALADIRQQINSQFGAEYLPEVSDWQDTYLIRTFADWALPINGWLDRRPR